MKRGMIILLAGSALVATLEMLVLSHKSVVNREASVEPSPAAIAEPVPLALINQAPSVPNVSVERRSLELELLGTLVNGSYPAAFIRDVRSGTRAMYRVGNTLQGALIVRIVKGEVTFDAGGELLRLTISGVKSGGRGVSGKYFSAVSPELMIVNTGELIKGQKEIFRALKQIKVTPQYENRKVNGLRINGFGEDSVINSAGLRNNDVIREVNNQKIDSYKKALQVFMKVRTQPEIKVSLVREGLQKQLSYRLSQ